MAEPRRSAANIPAHWEAASGPPEDERAKLIRYREQIRRELLAAGKDSSPETIDRVLASIAETGRLPDNLPDAQPTGIAGDVADHWRAVQQAMFSQLGDVAAAYGGDPTAMRAAAADTAARMTPEYQQQLADLEREQGFGVLGEYFTTPGLLSKGIASSIPLLAGALATRGLGPALLPRAAGPVARAVAGGLAGEGVWGAQQTMGQLVEAGVPRSVAAQAAAGAGSVKGILGGAGAAVTRRFGGVDPDVLFGTTPAATLAGRVGAVPAAMLTEGAEEVAQEVAQAGFGQVARGEPFFAGGGTTAAHGFALGAALGGAVTAPGVFRRGPARPDDGALRTASKQAKAGIKKDVRAELREDEEPPEEPTVEEPTAAPTEQVTAAEPTAEPALEAPPAQPDTEAWKAASETTPGPATAEQIASAIESRRVEHEQRAGDEALTEAQRADAQERTERGTRMQEVLRGPGQELQDTLRRINRRRGTTQRENVMSAVQAVTRETVKLDALEVLEGMEGDTAANAAYILNGLTDRNRQAIWRNADAEYGSPGEARLANPRYQRDALLRHVLMRAAPAGQPVSPEIQAVLDTAPAQRPRAARRRAPEPPPVERTGAVSLETTGTAEAAAARAGVETDEPLTRVAPKLAETAPTERTQAFFPGTRERVPARFAVIEAADLQPSHDPTTFGQTDPALYPARMQGRAYTGQARNVVEQAVLEPDATLLTRPQGESVAGGPPTVLPGGAAVSGNQRSMIIKRVYGAGGENAAALRAAVVREAGELGMQVPEGAREPVLVRMLEPDQATDIDRLRALNLASDVTDVKAKTPMEDAAARVERLTNAEGEPGQTLTLIANRAGDQTLAEFEAAQASDLTNAMLSDGIITDADRGRYLTADTGTLTDDGRRLLNNVLKVAALGSVDAANALTPEADAKLGNAWHGIIAANRNVPLTGMMGAYARLSGAARGAGLTPGEMSRQGGFLEGAQYSDALGEFARWLDGTPAGQIRAAMESIANENMDQVDMFTGEAPTVESLADKYFGVKSPWTTEVAPPAVAAQPAGVAALRGGNTLVNQLQAINRLFERIGRLPDFFKSVLTQGIQRGAIARARGERAVREGRVAERPGWEQDITLAPVIQAERLFGDLVKAVSRAGYDGERWDGLVVNGVLAADAPPEVKWAFNKGVLEAGREVVDSGLVAADTDVDAVPGALDAALKAVGGERKGLGAQGVVDALTNAVGRARVNRGRASVRDWQRGEGKLGEKAAREADDTIEVWEDGKRAFYKSDPYIAAYTKSDGGVNSLVKSLSTVGNLARAGQLTFNLGWQLMNIPRDFHRSLVNDPNYHRGLGILYAFNDLARSFPTALEARLDPLERARIAADPRTSEGRRARLEELATMERIGWMPSETRADIMRGRIGGDVPGQGGRVPDIRKMLGRGAAVGRDAWGQFFSANPFSYMPGMLDVLEARTRVGAWKAFEREHGRPPTERDVNAILGVRETVGSPAYGPTYRGTIQGVSSLFHYGQSIANGFIADHRALVNPTTRKGALAMLTATVIAPAIFQSAVREGLLGGEDDEGFWGDYVRGLKALPTWRLGVGLHLPAYRRVNEDGEREFVMLTMPINPTFAPLGMAIAGFGAQVGAGDSAMRAAMGAASTYLDESLPSSAVAITLGEDVVQFARGENPQDEFRGRGVFTAKEFREFSPGEKVGRMLYHVGDKLGWGGTVGGIVGFFGDDDLVRARSRADEQGLAIEEAPGVGPFVKGVRLSAEGIGARFLSTRADYGRSESIRLEQEAEAARTRPERRAATRERSEAVEAFRQANEFGPGLPRAIQQAARGYSRTLTGTTAQKAAKVRQFKRDVFLGYPEHEALKDALWAPNAAAGDEAIRTRAGTPTGAENIRGLIRSAQRAGVIGDTVAARWRRIAGRSR